jgi:hypothetical protein
MTAFPLAATAIVAASATLAPAPRGSPALDQLLVMRLPDGLRLLGRCQPGGDVGGNSIQFRVCGEHLAHAPVELVLVGRQEVEP